MLDTNIEVCNGIIRHNVVHYRSQLSFGQTEDRCYITPVMSEYLYIVHTLIYDLSATPVYTHFRIAVAACHIDTRHAVYLHHRLAEE